MIIHALLTIINCFNITKFGILISVFVGFSKVIFIFVKQSVDYISCTVSLAHKSVDCTEKCQATCWSDLGLVSTNSDIFKNEYTLYICCMQ